MTNLFRAARLAAEYSSAWIEAMRAAENGAPVLEVLQTFAKHTDGELDDKAVEALSSAIDEAVKHLSTATYWAGKLAFTVEDAGPQVVALLADIGRKALALSLRLDSIR